MMKRFQLSLLLLPLLGNLLFSTSTKADLKGSLNVEIDGLRSDKGEVCINLFAGSRGFPDDSKRTLKKHCVAITANPLVVKFDNLKAGNYAIVVMHDENNDKTFNRDSLGMPLEGFGFSQNPEITNSAPKYSQAAFLVAGPSTDIKINLQYMSVF